MFIEKQIVPPQLTDEVKCIIGGMSRENWSSIVKFCSFFHELIKLF